MWSNTSLSLCRTPPLQLFNTFPQAPACIHEGCYICGMSKPYRFWFECLGFVTTVEIKIENFKNQWNLICWRCNKKKKSHLLYYNEFLSYIVIHKNLDIVSIALKILPKRSMFGTEPQRPTWVRFIIPDRQPPITTQSCQGDTQHQPFKCMTWEFSIVKVRC